MTVITRLSIGENDPTKTNSAINQIAEYIDTNASVWANAKVKVGSFTRDTSLATGTQAVTGIGFLPRAVIFLAGDAGASNDGGVGIDDGTSSGALANFNAITAGNFQAVVGRSIKFVQSAANVYDGKIQSLDSDGFTVSWTKTSSPTGTKTITYLAIA